MSLSEKTQKILDIVDTMTVVELNETVKALEEKFWVSATPVMVAWWAAADAGAGAEKDTVNLELTEIWQQKINVIKVVKELLWLSLTDAKTLVEKAPTIVKENIKMEEAETLKAKLQEAWATVTLK